MKISKKSWNYKLWKSWHKEGIEPKNLCRYFWFSAYQWTLGLVIGAFVGLCFVFVGAVVILFAWFIGFRPNLKETFCGYKVDLYNFKPCGRKYLIAPWEVIAVLLVAFGAIKVLQGLFWTVNNYETVAPHLLIVRDAVGAVTGVILAGWLFTLPFKKDGMIRTYLRARKEKWCPTIQLVD